MTFILETKLHIPQLSERLIQRLGLTKRLHAGLARKLIIISAPAGYGKTTLLGQWIRQMNTPVAWFAIDQGDNDPVRFLSYLIVAIQTIQSDLGKISLKMLQSQSKTPSMEYILGYLINDLSSLKDDVVVVLDDYHVIDSNEVHQSLSYFLEHLPGHIHLVLATRSDPPLRLARLRSQHQIVELRASDLCFTLDETSDFLNNMMQLGLSSQDIQKLNARIEGWIAGIQMAAISLQGKEHKSDFVRAFSSSNRYVMDYLVEEVFSSQPENMQNFLMQTSILNRMNGRLCNAVTGRQDGQETLERLDQANLFMIPLDDRQHWYR